MSSLTQEVSPTRREKSSCKVTVPLASALPLLVDNTQLAGGSNRRPAPGHPSIFSIMVSAICFIAGVQLGGITGGTDYRVSPPVAVESTVHCLSEDQVQERMREAVRRHEEKQAAELEARRDSDKPKVQSPDKQDAMGAARFPPETQDVFVGMARVARSDFATMFNSMGLGVPFDNDTITNREAIIMYRSTAALPRKQSASSEATKLTTVPLLPVSDATENCDVVTVALVSTSNALNGGDRECLAVAGDKGGAFHLHRFMRMAEGRSRIHGSRLNHSASLKLFGAAHDDQGHNTVPFPNEHWSKYYRETLSLYLGSLNQALEKLAPIAGAAAVNNTIVVMTCNYGQSDLLVNFVCGARRRKLDLSSVVVFPTDEETLAIALGLGLHAFYDESAFGFVPKEAAAAFGVDTFGKAVLSKVICSHMVTQLGYDLLLQDVDVSWYRNPLDYFLGKEHYHDVFDMYIQDDGSGMLPQQARRSNAGFFFARNNEVTRSFFHDYLMAGDKILQGGNDQSVFNVILNEYSSLYGLRIWTFPDFGEFPSGFVFHRRKEYMKALLAGAMKPYIFHMSWTSNKHVKVKYLQQMGDWFVRDACVQKPLSESSVNASLVQKNYASMIQTCCLRDPDIRCHYRDKPSIIPCKESPAAGLIGDSFW